MDRECLELIDKVKKYSNNANEKLIEQAYNTAKKAHGDQLRYSGEPYFVHPYQVATILTELEMDSETIAAGLLHDIVEDTEYTTERMIEEFGTEVSALVEGVTKLAKIPYKSKSKEQQQIENLRKMFLAMADDIRVIIIKLADRLHNMRTLKSMREDKQREKAKEVLDVYAPLAHRLGISKVKWELEDLALRFLDPVAYYEIVESINQKKAERDNYISDIMENVSKKVEELGVKYRIDGRAKHFYSIFRKMYAQNKSIDEIYDLFAVRIIVDSIAECYAVLGVVHENYKPIPGRFKDYIAMPKPNMYQSLHTTVIGPGGTTFEIQIRTWDMHRTAEYGIAAHWKYKEGTRKSGKDDDKLEWVRQMLEVQKDLSNTDSEEFLKTLKIDLFSDEIFVFTPKGDVINLPAGSCAIDLAYAIHSAIGNQMIGAKINGKIATIDQKLKTGDIIQILTSSSHGPSKDWLKFVKTSQARNKINQWFKTHNREENIAKGKDIVDKEVRKADIEGINEFKEKFALEATKKFALNTADDMYAALGYEGPLSAKIYKKLKDEIKKVTVKTDGTKTQKTTNKRNASGNGVTVRGIEHCLVRLSKCCNPVPGDEIVGYVTRGRGVSVHRKDCTNVTNASHNESIRMIEVLWDNTTGDSYNADLLLYSVNRSNLLLEIAAELSNMKVVVNGVNARVDKNNMCVIDLAIEVSKVSELETVIKKLKNISGVYEITRNNK